MEFQRLFVRRHLAGKPVVASPNVGCFLRLGGSLLWELNSGELLNPLWTQNKDLGEETLLTEV